MPVCSASFSYSDLIISLTLVKRHGKWLPLSDSLMTYEQISALDHGQDKQKPYYILPPYP